ncbi:Ribosomal protein L9/RNase H1, N-terminal [Sesbania bispinosa]|nr:Ribosomal protein L9/RNase H1, N-terminal [Sesbania bispinosa]
MKSSRSGKFYVVFVGRQPGIYGSWEECESQVLGYSGNKHQSFKSLEEAHVAWMRYFENDSEFQAKPSFKSPNPLPKNFASASSSNAHRGNPTQEDKGKSQTQYVEHNGVAQFVVNCSMQEWLKEVCVKLRISEPRITLSKIKNFQGVTYYSYFAILQTNNNGGVVEVNGKFAADSNDAREDVAVELLRTLLDSSGKKIKDFNYYNPMTKESSGKGNIETSKNPTLAMLAIALEKVVADLDQLKQDVNREFAQLKEMVKLIVENISHVDNSKLNKGEHITTMKNSGGPTSVDLNDCPHNDSTPVSNKSKTNSTGKSKSKPIPFSSQKKITPRIGDIDTVVLVSRKGTTSRRPKKIPKMTDMSSLTDPTKERSQQSTINSKTNNLIRANGHTLPKNVLCDFPPTPEMGLSKEQAQACAYAFHQKMDPRHVQRTSMQGHHAMEFKTYDALMFV